MDASVLWRRLDRPGHEAARLVLRDGLWRLSGTAVFVEQTLPCRLNYEVVCDAGWRTVSVAVAGWVGIETIDIDITVDAACRWRMNGEERPEVAGCLDIDLNFSPSTNLLPIRRLGLEIGQEADVRAAWLRFPTFALEPLEQRYRRIDAATYRYESAGGRFVAVLSVDSAGFVTNYPGFFEVEGPAAVDRRGSATPALADLSFTIRRADSADAAGLSTLADQLGYPTQIEPLLRRLSAAQARPDHEVLLAERDGAIVGWVHVLQTVNVETDPCAAIGGLVVDAAHRGRGVGAALLAAAEEWATRRGERRIRVRSNVVRAEAHRFYEKHGYSLTKQQAVFDKSLGPPP